MKMLTHRIEASTELPAVLAEVKNFVRVDFDEEDSQIENMIYTAAAEIEHFAQIALLTQTIRLTIFQPSRDSWLTLPIGPVADGETPTVTIDGEPFTAFDFVAGNRPCIRWLDAYFALTPDRISIEYQAGFGPIASYIPRDLSQALMDQVALHFDGRSPMDAKSLTTSPHMARIGARYRGVRA